MRNMIFAGAAAFAICSAGTIAALPAMAQDQAPVIQTQANPPGVGMPSDTAPNPPTADTPVPPAMPADSGYQAGPYKGALTSAPAEAMGKAYPLCTRSLQDSCVNPGEAAAGSVRATRRARRLHRN
jgi:hypothetical protein